MLVDSTKPSNSLRSVPFVVADSGAFVDIRNADARARTRRPPDEPATGKAMMTAEPNGQKGDSARLQVCKLVKED